MHVLEATCRLCTRPCACKSIQWRAQRIPARALERVQVSNPSASWRCTLPPIPHTHPLPPTHPLSHVVAWWSPPLCACAPGCQREPVTIIGPEQMGAWLLDLCSVFPVLAACYTFVDASLFWTCGGVSGVVDLTPDPLDIRGVPVPSPAPPPVRVCQDWARCLCARAGRGACVHVCMCVFQRRAPLVHVLTSASL